MLALARPAGTAMRTGSRLASRKQRKRATGLLTVGTVAMVHAPAALAGAALRTVREVSAGFGRVIASTLRLPNLLARMV